MQQGISKIYCEQAKLVTLAIAYIDVEKWLQLSQFSVALHTAILAWLIQNQHGLWQGIWTGDILCNDEKIRVAIKIHISCIIIPNIDKYIGTKTDFTTLT